MMKQQELVEFHGGEHGSISDGNSVVGSITTADHQRWIFL